MNTCYIVAFEISDAIRDALLARLKAYGTYCPINRNCWAIVTDQTAASVRDNLRQVLAPTDRIFVVRSGTEAAWFNAYSPANSQWLKEHL